jgi:hypothetical protein
VRDAVGEYVFVIVLYIVVAEGRPSPVDGEGVEWDLCRRQRRLPTRLREVARVPASLLRTSLPRTPDQAVDRSPKFRLSTPPERE